MTSQKAADGTPRLSKGPSVAERPPPPSINADQMKELLLVAAPSAIPCARMLVGSVAHNWELASSVTAMLSEVVDVLVAHAVATTGRAAAEPHHHEVSRVLPLLAVRIRQEPTCQVIEVWDEGTDAPRGLDETAPLLRNLLWGYQHATPDQRVVWCVLAAEHDVVRTVPFRPVLPCRGSRLFPVEPGRRDA